MRDFSGCGEQGFALSVARCVGLRIAGVPRCRGSAAQPLGTRASIAVARGLAVVAAQL